jgi:hypothetical protein
VQCGDTITESTKLDSDVVCAADFRGTAVWIAAGDVVFNLAGHAIRHSRPGSGVGIEHLSRFRKSEIKNGTVEGFYVGVNLRGIDHAVRRLHITAPGAASASRAERGRALGAAA